MTSSQFRITEVDPDAMISFFDSGVTINDTRRGVFFETTAK